MSIRCELPFPPPLSACFTHVTRWSPKQGRNISTEVTTKRYKEWQADAHRMIRAQDHGEPMLMQEVNVRVRLVAPNRIERDAGNLDKAIMDILVSAGLITNDSNRYVRDLYYQWRDEGCPVVVFITPHVREDLLR